MTLLGLTGGIASGKSFVGRRLAARGIPVIDADNLAREAVKPGSEGFAEVARQFPEVIRNGEIDRQMLGRIVFADQTRLSELEGIVHPRVREFFLREKACHGSAPLVVYEVPLLFERGIDSDMDRVLVVDVPESLQLERLLNRAGMTAEEARRRISAQMGRKERLSRADVIISGALSEEETDRALSRILLEILSTHATPQKEDHL